VDGHWMLYTAAAVLRPPVFAVRVKITADYWVGSIVRYELRSPTRTMAAALADRR